MAVVHTATLTPTKLELLTDWLPAQAWSGVMTSNSLAAVGAYRFDDPDGEVGIETHLVSVDGSRVLQVPLTYRAAPLEGADEHLVGTVEHTALGQRWVYDGVADPVCADAFARAVLTGGTEAAVQRQTADGFVPVPTTTHVRGTGGDLGVDAARLEVIRRPDVLSTAPPGAPALLGTWPGQPDEVLLALVHSSV